MTGRIFRTILSASLLAVAFASTLILWMLYDHFTARIAAELQTEARYVSHALDKTEDKAGYLDGLQSGRTRVTWVAADGEVLFDSAADAGALDNHRERPEIQRALEGSAGESERYSATLSENTLYYAVRLQDGTVLRLSNTQQSVWVLLLALLQPFLLIFAGTLILSFVLADRMAKRIVRPINTLNLDDPASNQVYDELAPLLSRIAQQNRRIDRQMQELTRRQQQFQAVTGHMREGLVVLGAKNEILSLNAGAARLFGVKERDLAGKNVLALNRSQQMRSMMERAHAAGAADALLPLHGRYYQLFVSAVREQDRTTGYVLLTLDVTERQQAEQSRREFSANVSHELKTPLTSISGYAEIMREGLVKPEDVAGFAGRISEEASRLIALIDDIIRLSRLDERDVPFEKEEVPLLETARQVCARLQPRASERGVSLIVHGEEAMVRGVRRILDEMLCNLCDNAVKYNKEGGRVEVTVSKQSGRVVLTVADTGIGIPEAEQSKVFERFYRVDKSHSKANGGTGLGLSIVKHGAAYHDAEVRLESRPGEGTTVRLFFPR